MMRLLGSTFCLALSMVSAGAQTIGPVPVGPIVHAGGSAGLASTWLNKLAPGTDYSIISPLMTLSPPGGAMSAFWVAGRTSDTGTGQTPLPTEGVFDWDDYNPGAWSTWARYTESNLTSSFTVALATTSGSTLATVPVGTQARVGMPLANNANLQSGTTVSAVSGTSVTLSKPASGSGSVATLFGTVGYHIGEENSVYSLWSYKTVDPYVFSPLGASRNLRLDCGKGADFEKFGAPQRCSDALEIVNNHANYGKGIVFGGDALDTTEYGLGQAVVMAPNQGLVWYQAPGAPGWTIYQDAMVGAGGFQYQLALLNGYAQTNAIWIAAGYIAKLYTPPSSSSPCAQGQFSDDASYHYVCTAANHWKRAALSDY